MDTYEVTQKTELVDLYKKGSTMILNPKTLSVTILDVAHKGDKRYSKWNKDCYRLADIQITGAYNGGTPRPFMFYLKELLENNVRHKVAPIIKNNMTYDRKRKGWIVDWREISENLKYLCEKILAQDVAPMLPPIKEDSQERKSKAGYGFTTLYASGQLFQAVFVY